MKLIRVLKEIAYPESDTPSGHVEKIYAEKAEDGAFVNHTRYKVVIKPVKNSILIRYLKNNSFHSNSGPAVFSIDEEDELEDEIYYLNGNAMSREEWLERRDRLQNEPFEYMMDELFMEM